MTKTYDKLPKSTSKDVRLYAMPKLEYMKNGSNPWTLSIID